MFLYGDHKALKHFDLVVETRFKIVNEESYFLPYTRLVLLDDNNLGSFVLATLYYRRESDAAKWHDLLFKAVDDTSSIEEAVNIFKHLANNYEVFSRDTNDRFANLKPL